MMATTLPRTSAFLRMRLASTVCVLGAALVLAAGCNEQTKELPPKTGETPKTGGMTPPPPPHPVDDKPDPKIAENLAKLSPEDQELARKQKNYCIVSEEQLGSMGVPVKVKVKDTEMLICCEACRDQLMANADAMISKYNALLGVRPPPKFSPNDPFGGGGRGPRPDGASKDAPADDSNKKNDDAAAPN